MLIASDLITDLAEKFRADGEIEIVKMTAQIKFDERIDKDATIKVMAGKIRAKQIMANATRVPAPPGLQS